jgi:NADH:ubiquinone oxidoreductase subunit E
MTEDERATIDKIIEGVDRPSDSKIRILQELQEQFKYLRDEHMRYVAEKVGTSYTDIYGIATFYSQFNLSPPGRHTIYICEGTSCHVKGGKVVLNKLKDTLGIDLKGTTDDRCFSLKSVRCIGCCGLAPVIMIDDETFARVRPSQVEEILSRFREAR